MSKLPSAFDALMSGARAAAARKRKSPHSTSIQNPNSPETVTTINQPQPATKVRHVSSSAEKMHALKKQVQLLKKKPSDFDPASLACWEKGEAVPFLFLCLAFDVISEESGRIVITHIVCNMLRTVMHATPEDLVPVVYLSANRIAPAHEGLELGIGDASIIKALAEACGRTEAQIRNQYKEKGDLGLVAKVSRSSQSMMRKPDPLTIRKVFNTFRLIAKESGKDSQEKRKNHIKALLVAATDSEPQYLIRLLQTKLRIKYAEQTLLAALGQAAAYSEEHSKSPPGIQSPIEEYLHCFRMVYGCFQRYVILLLVFQLDLCYQKQQRVYLKF